MKLEDYLNWAHVIVIPALAYVAYLVRDIRDEIRKVSDQVIDHNRWITEHDKHDDDRFARLQHEVERAMDVKNWSPRGSHQ